jgi:hypothetical protein
MFQRIADKSILRRQIPTRSSETARRGGGVSITQRTIRLHGRLTVVSVHKYQSESVLYPLGGKLSHIQHESDIIGKHVETVMGQSNTHRHFGTSAP